MVWWSIRPIWCRPVSYTHLVSTQQINAMLDEIENEIFNCEDKEVETTVIGELVMDKLKKLDEGAYVRFASVYREFKDVNTFMEELGKLLKK